MDEEDAHLGEVGPPFILIPIGRHQDHLVVLHRHRHVHRKSRF